MNDYPALSYKAGDRTDSINVARVRPGTSKGITDLLLLLLYRLRAGDPAKKRHARTYYRRYKLAPFPGLVLRPEPRKAERPYELGAEDKIVCAL